MLEGPTAVAISTEDEVTPAQVIKKFSDDYELPRVKGGMYRVASFPTRR